MGDIGPISQRTDHGTLRLYTHNIWCRHGDWSERRRVLIDGIQALEPDLITFQETVVLGGDDQVSEILGGDYQVVHSHERSPDGMGISIASRWPIHDTVELDLNLTPRTGDFACTTVIAEIDAPEPFGPLLLVNHFPDYQVDHEHERELQTLLAARAIEERVKDRATHVLLSGDLDAEPDAASLRFLAGKQSLDGLSVCYRNAWDAVRPGEPGETYVAGNPLAPDDWPFQRIDHIFIRCGEHGGPTLRIVGCDRVFDEAIDGVWASDHFGLMADFAPYPGGGPQ
jgi:endonuclease/exonuclease/phosphatase family metal-dependent hydrolase